MGSAELPSGFEPNNTYTPVTDRDELVERLTERANIVASVQRYYVTGLGGMELEKDLRQAAARIQADAATIAAAKRVLEWWPENSELASRAGKEKGLSFAKDIQALRAALKGGDHG